MIILISTMPVLSALTIREQRTGRLIATEFLEDDTFSLQWMHSVELEQWKETFRLTTNGEIQLIESRFKAFGAGTPDTGGREFFLDGDWFVARGFDVVVPSLDIGVSKYSKHRLIINNHVYPLYQWVDDGEYVSIQKEWVSPLQYWKYRILRKEASYVPETPQKSP